MSAFAGGCLCGDVRFSAPAPSKWVAHCHCTLCRRHAGAGFVTWVGLEAARVAIDDPHSRLAWYASSATGERGFCARCGSSLFFRSPRWAGELHVVRAAFEGEVDRAPQVHVFWDSHVDWADVDPNDGLPRKTAAEVG
jgi:hypothetical protein